MPEETPTIQLGTTPSGLISNRPPLSPHFYAVRPSCHNLPNLSWLGTGTRYAGLHIQWPGYGGIGQTIIFLPCGFFLSSFFLSSPNLSGRRLDVYHTSTHGRSANLERRSEMCCKRLAGNTGCKNDAKNHHMSTIAQLRPAIS